jgi:hypothetical protein
MNNKAPKELKETKQTNGCKLQLIPLDMYQQNITEWMIKIFKNHFIFILVGLSDDFSIY